MKLVTNESSGCRSLFVSVLLSGVVVGCWQSGNRNLAADEHHTDSKVLATEMERLYSRRQMLVTAAAEKFSPEGLAAVNKEISSLQSDVMKQRGLNEQIEAARHAIRNAETAYRAVQEIKRERVQQEIYAVEAKIAQAISQEAALMVPEKLGAAQELFENALVKYYDEEHDEALKLLKALNPKLDELVSATVARNEKSLTR